MPSPRRMLGRCSDSMCEVAPVSDTNRSSQGLKSVDLCDPLSVRDHRLTAMVVPVVSLTLTTTVRHCTD